MISPRYIPLLIPAWAKIATVSVTLGPSVGQTSALWATVQQRQEGGQWADVGGLYAEGLGRLTSARRGGSGPHVSSTTSVHRTNAALRIATNTSTMTYSIVFN